MNNVKENISFNHLIYLLIHYAFSKAVPVHSLIASGIAQVPNCIHLMLAVPLSESKGHKSAANKIHHTRTTDPIIGRLVIHIPDERNIVVCRLLL